MMMASTRQLSLLVLVLCTSSVLASGSKSQSGIRADFVRAMEEATQRKEESKRQTSLMKRMLKSAKLVKNAFGLNPPPPQDERELGNGNWNYGYYNYYQQDDDYYQQQDQNQQQNQNEGDDAFAQYGGLNLTQYALKYLGCQNIHSFSDDMAADNDVSGSLAMDRFVVFRLCPKEHCSNYAQYGCQYNYGEYTMPMEDYLVTMQTYHIQQYQEFCQTCVSCMTGTGDFSQDDDANNNQNNRNLANDDQYNYNGGGQYYYYKNGDDDAAGDDYYANNDDGNANNGDDGNGYEADAYNNYNAYANDDMFNNDDASNQTEYVYQCIYADVCSSYQDACAPEMFTDDNYMANSEAYSEYFECAEFDVGGAVSYLGPHCRSDGFTIGIGIYDDQYCSSYIGDMVDMEEATGQEFNDDYLSPYYPKQCISCAARESYDLLTDDEINDENGGLYEVCGELYELAAKCNRYMGDPDTGFYGQYQQEANENDVCNFVSSLVENNYDEYGEAVLESPEWELAKWKQVNAYRQDMVERATPAQLLTLLFSIGLVVALIGYIVYLRYKLTRRMPWTRGFGASKEAGQAGQLARAGSGITMQRSLSNLEPGYSASGSFA